jgi:pimeloyl-ACP methyl ester carboxylesterase
MPHSILKERALMTQFLDVRTSNVGGGLAARVAVGQGTSIADYDGLDLSELLNGIRGQHVLIATHGFNVDRADGIEYLSNFGNLLQCPPSTTYLGLLWPGESVWMHGCSNPDGPKTATQAGRLMATFLDANFGEAATISFVSHSLGARLVLETALRMSLPVRNLILLGAAIDDNCMNREYKSAADKVESISVLSSRNDQVLSMVFPLCRLFSGIMGEGHPWWRSALGQTGPSRPRPAHFVAPYQIPDNWSFDHGDYMQINFPPAPALPIPTNVPPDGSPVLFQDCDMNGGPMPGWQAAFAAAFVSSRLR